MLGELELTRMAVQVFGLQAAQILLEESPAIFWYVGENIEAVTADVQNYTQSYTGRRIFLQSPRSSPAPTRSRQPTEPPAAPARVSARS